MTSGNLSNHYCCVYLQTETNDTGQSDYIDFDISLNSLIFFLILAKNSKIYLFLKIAHTRLQLLFVGFFKWIFFISMHQKTLIPKI